MPQVLVVDDEPRIVDFVSRALAAEGLGVDSASDGHRGLQMATSGRYELVVLDLLLPGKDGVSVLEDLMQARPEQRVLVLSALTDVENKVRCLELGASDYLHKPFALIELVARVRARLRQPASGPGERSVECGGVTLDLLRRTADPGSGPVALSEREFLLLRYLIHTRGAGGDLIVEVADDGAGIPRDQLGRIFDRFARADSDRARGGGGTGLGLPIARAIARAHGGDLTAQSEPGRGSVLSFRLPGFEPVRAGVPALSNRP